MADAEEDGSSRLVFDCFSALLLLLTALLGAYLPRYLSFKGGQQSGTATSLAFHLGNMLSGGVMLSAGFCHLLADSLRQLAFIGRFPIATFLAAVGYLITLLADQLVQVLTADGTTASASTRTYPAKDAAGHKHNYTRLDRQQEWGDAIEMTAPANGWHGTGGVAAAAGRGYDPGVAPSRHMAAVTGSSSSSSGRVHGAAPTAASRLSVCVPAGSAAAVQAGCISPSKAAVVAADSDVARCVMATGSPRAITADSIVARSSRGGASAVNGLVVEHGIGRTAPFAVQASSTSSTATASGLLCNDDLAVSHPSTPDPVKELEQQQKGQQCCLQQQADLLGVDGLREQQEEHSLARRQVVAAYSAADDADLSRLPVSTLLVSTASPKAAQQQQQQQQQRGWDPGVDLGSWAEGAYIETGVAAANQPAGSSGIKACGRVDHCCPCCSTGSSGCCCKCSSELIRHRSDVMTEASTVARAAEHLELEIISPAGAAAGGHGHAHFQVFLSHQPLSFATTVLLACALCIHSVLEGVALGAQHTMEATQDIMLAIAAHKGLAAYALGASIVESKASTAKFWTVVAMFASATPLGIAIGYASSNIGHGSAGAAMSALASGTFLYVALNEVIPKELEHPDGHRLLKVAALLIGFGLMSLLAVWA